MAALIILAVYGRYILSIAFPEVFDLTTILLGWTIMLAAGAAFVLRNPAMPEAATSPVGARAVGSAGALLGGLICGSVAAGAFGLMQASLAAGDVLAGSSFPSWMIDGAAVAGFGLAAVMQVRLAVARLAGQSVGGREHSP